MASTARAMDGISRATAAATWRSSALMISRIPAAGSASMPCEAGLTCSVKRFSSEGSGKAGLPHHGARCFESQAGGRFGGHILEASAKHFDAERVFVADLVKGLQEPVQVDDAL